jgi:hypothetical protein
MSFRKIHSPNVRDLSQSAANPENKTFRLFSCIWAHLQC